MPFFLVIVIVIVNYPTLRETGFFGSNCTVQIDIYLHTYCVIWV